MIGKRLNALAPAICLMFAAVLFWRRQARRPRRPTSYHGGQEQPDQPRLPTLPRMFVCTYCLERKPDSERSEEHVIPAALGGAWTVMDVCEGCQEWANVEIDRPFIRSLWVLEQRHRLRIPDRYGNVPDAPRVNAAVADGRPAIVTLSPGGWELELPPSSRAGEEDEALEMTVSVDDEAEYIAKKIKRFERDNPGFTWKTTRREVSSRVPLDVTLPFSIPVTLWPRFAVKVALTVGRELHGEQWLRSDHGLLLNRLLWSEEEKVRMNPLPTKQTFWARSGWTPPPNHVVITMDVYGSPMVLITLFGEDSYAVPLGDPPHLAAPHGCCTRMSGSGSD